MATPTVTPVKAIKEFFGMNLAEMKAEWIQKEIPDGDPRKLTELDKAQLAEGIGNDTLTY